jgi:hypothetical protein
MGVFKSKPEVVDARQLDGTREKALELMLWVQSNEGRAEIREYDPHTVNFLLADHYASRAFTIGYKGDWVILRQSGIFELMRNEEFTQRYEQQ